MFSQTEILYLNSKQTNPKKKKKKVWLDDFCIYVNGEKKKCTIENNKTWKKQNKQAN